MREWVSFWMEVVDETGGLWRRIVLRRVLARLKRVVPTRMMDRM